MIGRNSFVVVLDAARRQWELYDNVVRNGDEAQQIADELIANGGTARVLSGDAYYCQRQTDALNIELLQATIPDIDIFKVVSHFDLERLRWEKGYGCDRDVPYECSLDGLNLLKLVRLLGKVARNEFADDTVTAALE